MTPPAIEAAGALVKALRDEEGDVKSMAQVALQRMGRGAVPALRDGLTDPDAGTRRTVADALGFIGPDATDAVAALIASYDDQDEGVRGNAIQALTEIGPAAVPARWSMPCGINRTSIGWARPRRWAEWGAAQGCHGSTDAHARGRRCRDRPPRRAVAGRHRPGRQGVGVGAGRDP